MKILIATGIYPPDIGGPATYSHLLKTELPKRGAKVEILSFSEVRHLPKILRHFVYFLKVIGKGRGADVIFAQDPVSVGLPAALAAKFLRKKFVLKIVGDYAWEQGMQRWGVQELLDEFLDKKYSWQVELLKKVERFVAKKANKIVVPSNYLKAIVTKWGVSEDKIFTVYNAYSPPTYLQYLVDRTGVSEKIKFNLIGKVIVSVGRLVPWKGFMALIDIMPELVNRFPDLQLVIIGDGPDRTRLKQHIESNKLQKHVTLTGEISHNEVLEYLKVANIFVLNTAYEGFSHQILEAMSIGTPVITTDAGGNLELIENGKEGFLVKFNDKKALKEKIISIFNKEIHVTSDNVQVFFPDQEVSKYVENAKKKAKQFSRERMINETIKILN